ncbi:hypothetical protein Tco_0687057 [Tanacetum coccineum]
MTYKRDYLFDFKEYDSVNVLLSDDKECRIRGTGKVQVQMRDGSSFVLDKVGYVSELRWSRSDQEDIEGYKLLGEYQNIWKIKTSNILDSFNQGSTQQCMKSEVTIHLGVVGIQKQNWLVEETHVTLLAKRNVNHVAGSQEVQTQDLIDYHSPRDREQHSTRELFRYREDSNKIGLKEDMDVWSDVHVLRNGCKKSSNDSDGYYREYTPGITTGSRVSCIGGWTYVILLGISDKKNIEDSRANNAFFMFIAGSVSGDCDVENKRSKWSYVYAVRSQGLQSNKQVFVVLDYAMGKAITIMGSSFTGYGLLIHG